MTRNPKILFIGAILLVLSIPQAKAILERGDRPWNISLRSYYDKEMESKLGKIPWYLNLGPTGIRARIYQDNPKHFVVKYVFRDSKSPARRKIKIDDVIVGANGKLFSTPHTFGRRARLTPRGGWTGPMTDLATHIEDSQGKDGILELIVWPKGDRTKTKTVPIQLKQTGRFSKTFPYNCERSDKLLKKLCDFIADDYKSSNGKGPDSFRGRVHTKTHQILALMASGDRKYRRIIKNAMRGYYDNRYSPDQGGFAMWRWGYEGILMGEYYSQTKDRRIIPAIKSLTKAMPWGSPNGNGIYAHRSEILIRQTGRKPYASIAAISGLQMVAMSIFKANNLPYDKSLYQKIHQHYLNSAYPDLLNIAYAFKNADRINPENIRHRHAIIQLENPSKGKSGKGPGYIRPTGMKDIGKYKIVWPIKGEWGWKPTDWVAAEYSTNTLTELSNEFSKKGFCRVDRNNPEYKQIPEPKEPYKTTRGAHHLAPIGMGAVAHMMGNHPKSWTYLGEHAANTCTHSTVCAFDGHGGSNMHAFWTVLGAAHSTQPKKLREFFDYMKTFIILSEAHNGGMVLQPWTRDRADTDAGYGPRMLPTATAAILLALSKKEIMITGKGTQHRPAPSIPSYETIEEPATPKTASTDKTPKDKPIRYARKIKPDRLRAMDQFIKQWLANMSQDGKLKKFPVNISKVKEKVWLSNVQSDGSLSFNSMKNESLKWEFNFIDMTANDRAVLACLIAELNPDIADAQAFAGVYMESRKQTKIADQYFEKAGKESTAKYDDLFMPNSK